MKPKDKKTPITKMVELLNRYFNTTAYNEQELKTVISAMTIADIINLDTAIADGDKSEISRILNKRVQLEYEMQGRTNLSSAAQNRPPVKTTSPKPAIGSLNSSELSAQKQLSTTDKQTQDELEKELKDKEEEIKNIKKLAGIQ